MVGIGYDIHLLVPERQLFLGGVQIDFPMGLAGHSDGDVLIHAICDALLGAANLGDIGRHFSPDDDRYKDISSLKLLNSVSKFLKNSGLMVKYIDTVIIAEAPRILPHVDKMKTAIANTLAISSDAISIKGKTNEGIGEIGEGKAIAAWAICQIGRIYATPER
ncbi:MAG: 2-C-methyl-D-erythritol 2,4-cyclodiphosphate synthase [candidate division WOR-3 bacterium]|nr:MAG: 2-C-methyl-D-erythritol 2,4-cyclodiphosphate synthase [candidate division WOR-3 bacterium]